MNPNPTFGGPPIEDSVFNVLWDDLQPPRIRPLHSNFTPLPWAMAFNDKYLYDVLVPVLILTFSPLRSNDRAKPSELEPGLPEVDFGVRLF